MSGTIPKPGTRGVRWLFGVLIFFIVVGLALFGGAAALLMKYDGRIFPGVAVGDNALAGRTPEEARDILDHAVNEWNARGLPVKADGRSMTLTTTVSAVGDLDLTYELMGYDIPETVRRAMTIGHGPDWFSNVRTGIEGSFAPIHLAPVLHVDEDAIRRTLKENFEVHTPARPAGIVFSAADGPRVIPDQPGSGFQYDAAVHTIVTAFQQLKHPIVGLTLTAETPDIRTADAEPLLPDVEHLRAQLPRSVVIQGVDGATRGTITLDRDHVGQWIVLERDATKRVVATVGAGLDAWLAEGAHPFEQEAVNAKFELVDGRVTNFQESAQGQKLPRNAPATVRTMLLGSGLDPIVLHLERVEPAITTSATNAIGIRELIGFGTSNFKGSPQNRRHNITTGAAKLNGIVIGSGEEFSLVKTLGEIEKETGYLPELVIKGDRTIPEYGGGLCQIGTTVFRAAMASGFPITERANHSYRVRYYEPAGTDATIYPPKPDFRFKNDTAGPVVLITKMTGDDLRFEFWGASDGRKAERTDPKIYNIVKPAPMKTIETEDLKPGEKKCTEIAHDGADASFTYTVTMPDGTTRKQVFHSHYKPWQAVCLVGVEKKKEEPASPGASPAVLPPPPDAGQPLVQ